MYLQTLVHGSVTEKKISKMYLRTSHPGLVKNSVMHGRVSKTYSH